MNLSLSNLQSIITTKTSKRQEISKCKKKKIKYELKKYIEIVIKILENVKRSNGEYNNGPHKRRKVLILRKNKTLV